MKYCLCLILAGLGLGVRALPQVQESLQLDVGWNAVYIESTPVVADCEEFFRTTPVIGAAAYRSDADLDTAQYDADGRERLQQRVIYLQWVRGEAASTLRSISGGFTYLLYATNSATVSFYGVPSAPRMNWHPVLPSATDEFFNLAGVSAVGTGISSDAYFGEGPFGAPRAQQAVYAIGGADPTNGPTLKKIDAFGRAASLDGGKAYALTAASAGSWPGVIGIEGNDEIVFVADSNYASVRVRNCGKERHTFELRLRRGEGDAAELFPALGRALPRVDAVSETAYTNVEEDVGWRLTLEPDEVSEQVFVIDRSQLVERAVYGAILSVEDLGPGRMRVRLPVSVEPGTAESGKYPAGLWYGTVRLEAVSTLTNTVPLAAGGAMSFNVLVHVDGEGTARLLQRAVLARDTNGTVRVFRELKSVPATCTQVRRVSSVVMSVDTPVVEAEGGSAFGELAAFAWNVGPEARDNPFRHAWHPDHDGRRADDNEAHLPSGDDPESYKSPIKPELWSVSNRVVFSWHEQNDPGRPVYFPYRPDETTTGYVTWMSTGLIASRPVGAMGVFTLKRVVPASRLED